MAISAWRLNLKPASYNGVGFYVDLNTRSGGRRKALHEFPKGDTPYLEDMGRKAKRFTVACYLIGSDYEDQRDALIEQLEDEGNGQLVHPTYTDVDTVGVESYSVTERREQGGYATVEIVFIEAGQDVTSITVTDTPSAVTSTVNSAVPSTSSLTGNDFSGSSDIKALT
jgi:prophage DNA circulation protein